MLATNHISIPLGIIIGLLASFVQSLGLTIQRKSHVVNQSLPDHRQRVEHRRPLWLLGFLIFILSNVIGSVVQIASLPVVILAPLGAVSLLWNAFFARLILGDVFSPWMILGTILIAGGAILIAFFGIVPEQTRSLEDLLELFRRPAFIAYFSVLGFIVFVCLVITHITEFSLSRRMQKQLESEEPSLTFSTPSSAIHLSTQSSVATADPAEETDDTLQCDERTPLIDPKSFPSLSLSTSPQSDTQCNDPVVNRTRLILAVSYASFSGIISGMCLLFAKSGVELLLLTLGGKNQFWRWESWVLVLGLIIFAVLQLWYLHKALILADPTLVCPSAFCFYNLSSIVNGLVYFDQFSLIPPLHLGLVILGIIVLLGGVWVVSIQSGGGGVDLGAWNEENVKLTGEDDALYAEPEEEEITEAPAVALSPPDNIPRRPDISPVPMERETRSESSLPNIPRTSLVGLGVDLGTEERNIRKPQGSVVSFRKRPRAETQLYPTPRTPSHSKRTATADISVSTSSILPSHSRTPSHPHPHPHPGYTHAPLSPPLGTVSTLGHGFQIGLSPLSPGFTIVPKERRRRPSALGGGGSGFADVVHEVVSNLQERRRTVSEGQIQTTPRRVRRGTDASRDSENVNSGVGDSGARDEASPGSEGNNINGRTRWRWLRKVFVGDD